MVLASISVPAATYLFNCQLVFMKDVTRFGLQYFNTRRSSVLSFIIIMSTIVEITISTISIHVRLQAFLSIILQHLCRYSNSSVLQYLNTMFCHQIHDSYQWENLAFYFQPMWSSNWQINIGIQMAILKFLSNRAKHYHDPISIHLALNWHLIVICRRGQFVSEWCSVIAWSQQKRLILAQIIDHGKKGQLLPLLLLQHIINKRITIYRLIIQKSDKVHCSWHPHCHSLTMRDIDQHIREG